MPIDSLYTTEQLQSVIKDPQRLSYHFMPPAGWMNDPNGLVKFKGIYHMYYQCYPFKPEPGLMHWGHATSKDLIHWEHQPLALSPSTEWELSDKSVGDYPSGGCFSGSVAEKDGLLYAMYTAARDTLNGTQQVQCVAISEDGFQFQKLKDPVILHYPEAGSEHFRDPKVWKHGNAWYCVIGSSKENLGKVLLYKSIDLLHWEYVGEMLKAESSETQGNMWECPNLIPMGEKDVLMFSPMGLEKKGITTAYFVGKLDYSTGKFHSEHFYKMNSSQEFYAPQVFYTNEEEIIILAWMQHWGVKNYPTSKYGWSGAMSIPLSCSLNEENKLLCAPVTQLEKLRIKDILIDISKTNPFEGVLLNCFECLLEIEILDFQKAFMELKLRCSSDETQYSSIKYQKGLFIVDCTRSGESGGCLQSEEAYSLGIKPRRVKIHAFVDSCSLEVFINNGDICFSHRIFPSIKSKFIKFVSNAEICLLDAKIYKLSSIW